MEWSVGDSPQVLTQSFVSYQASRSKEKRCPPGTDDDDALTICCYNVHFWLGPERPFQRNTKAILDTISAVDADVLVLQEFCPADSPTFKEENADYILERLANTGYVHHTWRESKQHEHTFVTVVLSREPLSNVRYMDLPEYRQAVCVRVRGLDICGVHLDVYDNSGNTRVQQLQRLLPAVEDHHLLMGDFNAIREQDYDAAQYQKFVEHDSLRDVSTTSREISLVESSAAAWVDCWTDEEPKVTTWNGRRIDFIFKKMPLKTRHWVHHSAASDHVPLVCRVQV